MIQYKVENITLTDDEKSFLIYLTIELEDFETDTDTVFISLSFSLANESSDLEEIKEKAIIHAKSLLRKVLLEDAQQDLF